LSAVDLGLMSYVHPTAGFTIPLPKAWERSDDTRGIALIAAAPESRGRFRSNIIVTIERLGEGVPARSWAAASIESLPLHLAAHQVVDLQETDIGGWPALRILSHYAMGVRCAVTLEQWLLVRGSLGYTLSMSVGTLDYARLSPTFDAVANGFRPCRLADAGDSG
jgi:hypothetical protein